MARNSSDARKPVFHAPIRFDWTDERLQTLDQDQLLTLLQNLDYQRSIGRMSGDDAGAIEARIGAFLTAPSRTKRRKKVALAAARAAG
jgi:hypothetical protein